MPGYEDVEAGIVKWPLSVIRLRGENTEQIIDLADHILSKWRTYTDEEAFIFAETDGVLHNTITPIARKKDGMYELDLTLRNNITTEEHPLGVYHPHEELHHIKKRKHRSDRSNGFRRSSCKTQRRDGTSKRIYHREKRHPKQ